MAIIRVIKDKNNPYVMLNKTCLQDSSISWKAKGLHSYVMSLPDGWDIYLSDLTNRSKDGKDSTNSALKELEKNGYLSRLIKRDEKGKLLGGYDYIFYEVPNNISPKSEKPKSEKPKSEKPKSEKPLLINNNITKETSLINNNITKETEEYKFVTRYVEQTLGIIGPNNTLELLSFLDDGVEADVIIRAIDLAIGNGKRNYNYVKGILNNWISEGIKKSAQLTEHLNNKKKKFDTYSIADNDKNYNNSGVNSDGKLSTDNDKGYGMDSKIEEEVGTFTDTSGIDWSKY